MIKIKPQDFLKKPKKSIQPISRYNKDAYVIPLHIISFPENILSKDARADMFTDMVSILFKKDNNVSLIFMPQYLLVKGKVLTIDTQFSQEAIDKLKKRIAKQKQIRLHFHYLYALALMWWYADWASTAEYDSCIKQMQRLTLDKMFTTTHKLPLYRALTISPKGHKLLEQGKTIQLKPRLGTSWSTGKRRPFFVAREIKKKQIEEQREQAINENKAISQVMRIPQPKIICLVLKKPKSKVIMNAYKLRLCDEFKKFTSLVTKNYKSLYKFLLDEIILEGNGGFSKIRLAHTTK